MNVLCDESEPLLDAVDHRLLHPEHDVPLGPPLEAVDDVQAAEGGLQLRVVAVAGRVTQVVAVVADEGDATTGGKVVV